MTDLTRLPSATDSATFVEAYREWQAEVTGDDDMAVAMFNCFPGSPDDHERCVTIDGLAIAAVRTPYGGGPGEWEYDLEHYVLDAQVTVTAPR